MKKLIIAIVFYLPLVCFSQASIEVLYEKKMDASSLNEVKNTSVREQLQGKANSFDELEYLLIASDSLAQFKVVDKLYSENFKKSSIKLGGGHPHYFRKNSKKVYRTSSFENKEYLVQNTLERYNWKVSSETKVINGYTCYRATAAAEKYIPNFSPGDTQKKTATVEYEAWFCPEFPYQYGPDEFYGLPGLVFEAGQVNSKVRWYIKKISKGGAVAITIPDLNVITEEQEYDIAKDYFKKISRKN